jgi:transcriptional regulator with XRE-family HTH domain
MVQNFWGKSEWTKEEWVCFLSKLDVLRFKDGLKKKEFSEKIGVWNIYRKDLKRPDPGTIERICKVYNVTPEWLCSAVSPDDSGSPTLTLSQLASDKITHLDIIQRFQNKDLAKEINARLLELEAVDPDQLRYIKGVLDGLLATLRLRKNPAVNG